MTLDWPFGIGRSSPTPELSNLSSPVNAAILVVIRQALNGTAINHCLKILLQMSCYCWTVAILWEVVDPFVLLRANRSWLRADLEVRPRELDNIRLAGR